LTRHAAFGSLNAVPITEIRIEGLRTIEKVRLRLDGLTVLIGDNGTGKSSILEACEILRRATGPRFLDELYAVHGGLTALLRQGAKRLVLAVRMAFSSKEVWGTDREEYEDEPVEYELSLTPSGAFANIEETIRFNIAGEKAESKSRSAKPTGRRREALTDRVCRRGDKAYRVGDPGLVERIDAGSTMLAAAPTLKVDPGIVLGEAQLVAIYLRGTLVHLPFETTPAWAARALDRKSALRTSALLTPATHLEKLGLNLASSYHALKNNFGRAHWDKTLETIRLGLGERIEDVVTWADPGGGNIGLSIKLAGLDHPIPSAQLSDGMLSYLAFVALFRLHATKPSLVAFDEPDLHLHPQLLMRVLDMFESMAREHPVLLATHSDRLLDGLRDPARSVVLCELDERGATRLVRPDREALDKWLTRYRGIGDIRGAGHAASVLTKVEPS
jgi:predicted ATPase